MTLAELMPILRTDNGLPDADTSYDSLLTDTAEAARADMVRAGLPLSQAEMLSDADVRMAVRLYVKGHLGLSYDEKYDALYESALKRLTAGGGA